MTAPLIAEVRERDNVSPEKVDVIGRFTSSGEGPAKLEAVDDGARYALEMMLNGGIYDHHGDVVTPEDGELFVRSLPLAMHGSRLWANLVDPDSYLDQGGRSALVALIRNRHREGVPADDLEREYSHRTPPRAISRCPITGSLVEIGIDTYGFDGPWWDLEKPLRRVDAPPPTFMGLTGAARDAEATEIAGPGRPFVYPRALDREGVVAVLSFLDVGSSPATAVTYFSAELPQDLVVPEWGTHWGRERQADGTWDWKWVDAPPGPVDTDIRPWIESGKLRWTAPGDSELTLREGLENCPYLE